MPDERPKVARPISIVSLTSQSMQQGISFFLFFIATINIELAVFNVLPIPLLDGGQALYYTIEAVIGHTLSSAEMSLIHFIYLMIIIILVLYLNRRARKRSV
jgi:regulator of sigma E protease